MTGIDVRHAHLLANRTSSLSQKLYNPHINRPARRHHHPESRQHMAIRTVNGCGHSASGRVNKPFSHCIANFAHALDYLQEVIKSLGSRVRIAPYTLLHT